MKWDIIMRYEILVFYKTEYQDHVIKGKQTNN